MIKTEPISAKVLKIVPSGKLTEDDFRLLAREVDAMIAKSGQIRLLIDASGFGGWENFAGFQAHGSFIKNHQRNVERLAVIVGHGWQHWLVDTVRMFLHPDARAFEKNREYEAQEWVTGP
jgi:hypothetical protein